jgi:hypothetical protein
LEADRFCGEIKSVATRAEGKGSLHLNFAILDVDINIGFERPSERWRTAFLTKLTFEF